MLLVVNVTTVLVPKPEPLTIMFVAALKTGMLSGVIEIEGFVTRNVLVIDGAALYVPKLPFWDAVIEQVPMPAKVMMFPFTVHTDVLFDVYSTNLPELAVAFKAGRGVPKTASLAESVGRFRFR
jgi:hypothetical protein